MLQTRYMRADEMANAFNGVVDRGYWKANLAGTRVNPEVHFNSRSSMVRVCYRIATCDFTVMFSRSSAAFGDFLASAHRSMEQVLTSLKAAGLPFSTGLGDDTVLRIEYDPKAKTTVVHIAGHGDNWTDTEPMPFKVPTRESLENAPSGVDAL